MCISPLGEERVTRTRVRTGIANRPADGPRFLRSLEKTLNTDETKKRLRRTRTHATRLAQRAIREAGTRRDVAVALGRSQSTVSHETTSRAHPELVKALEAVMLLNRGRATTARALIEGLDEALELRDIILEDAARLIARGRVLVEKVNQRDAHADTAALLGDAEHAEALRSLGSACFELAAIEDELRTSERGGISLLAEYRRAQS